MIQKSTILLIVLFLSFTGGLLAQKIKSAEKAYNAGIELHQQGDNPAAIESFQKCIHICSKHGAEGEELKLKAETKIYHMYISQGKQHMKTQKIDAAIDNFNESAKYAEMMGNQVVIDSVNNFLASSYNTKGNQLLKTKKGKKSIEYFQKSLEYDSAFAKAYLGLIQAYSLTDDVVKLEEAADEFFKLNPDKKTLRRGKQAISNYFIKVSTAAIEDENYRIAGMMLKKSIQYNEEEPMAYYYLALIENGTENWAEAKEMAMKGIALEQKDRSDLFFELARAYEGLGEGKNACDAYSKVISGTNTQAAIYQRKHILMCE